MPRVNWFDISAEKPERAAKFYKEAFGWKFKEWKGGGMKYWLITTGSKKEPGIDGGLSPRTAANKCTVNTIMVKSVDGAVKKVIKAGGKVIRPKMAIPMMGWIAMCQDTEGVMFNVMQTDLKAK